MRWPVGGRRLSATERAEILRVYFDEGKDAADKLAASHGLSPWYAYKLANQSGRLPLTRWSPLRYPNRRVPVHRHDVEGDLVP